MSKRLTQKEIIVGYKKVMAAQHIENLDLRGEVFELKSKITALNQELTLIKEHIKNVDKYMSILNGHAGLL